MIEINKFEQAVKKNEISAFFKGEGDYYSFFPMGRGEHYYSKSWKIMIDYLKNKENSFKLVVKYFKVYLNSLESNLLDAFSLFFCLQSYYNLSRSDYYPVLNNTNDLIEFLDDKERKKIGHLLRFLRDNFDKLPNSEDMIPFDSLFKSFKLWGCQYDFLSF